MMIVPSGDVGGSDLFVHLVQRNRLIILDNSSLYFL